MGLLDRNEIDARLKRTLSPLSPEALRVHAKEFAGYRFVDVFRAAASRFESMPGCCFIDSEHYEDLNSLLHAQRPQWASRRINQGSRLSWPIGPDEETFLPVDRFWVTREMFEGTPSRMIVRARYDRQRETTTLEVAANTVSLAQETVTGIMEESTRNSVYKNRVLELAVESAVRDEIGDVEKTERLRIRFKPDELVEDSDVVLSSEVRALLQRNVIDLHARRDVLKKFRIPVRRGVLLYGPPGTGKTFACRYVCGKLSDATRIVVTGTALPQVNAVFGLARLLQPSLLVLEDVDLVFSSRDINLYSSSLGDLLDQMDGLRPHEDVSFILTTNSIERMEAAIRDRPGRISQCIRFDAPGESLRREFIENYLTAYDARQLDMGELVSLSKGATQAFLKEWVCRAAQIATERLAERVDSLELRNDDFRAAIEEMRRFSEGATGRIIGFHG